MIQERNETLLEVIGIIIQAHGGILYSKTKLVKLLYLIDRHFAKKYGRTLTGIEYKSYFYGPYSDEIEEALNYLNEQGFVKILYEESPFTGVPYYVLKLINLPNFGSLTEEERKTVINIVKTYARKSLDEILDEVYDTEEYNNTPFGRVITLA